MRPVLHGDVSAAARALLAAPQWERQKLCALLIAEADLADQHVRRTGDLHPIFGNGSLMAAARSRRLADESDFGDIQYCQCFEMVLSQLIRFLVSRTHS